MKMVPLFALALFVSACGPDEQNVTNNSTTYVQPEGGPCGDGTVLGPNEHCR